MRVTVARNTRAASADAADGHGIVQLWCSSSTDEKRDATRLLWLRAEELTRGWEQVRSLCLGIGRKSTEELLSGEAKARAGTMARSQTSGAKGVSMAALSKMTTTPDSANEFAFIEHTLDRLLSMHTGFSTCVSSS